MDSGFLREGETLEDEFDVLKELLPEEVVGLMDQILCHEVRDLQGLRFDGRQEQRLMLILGLLDGMAYGPPALTVPLHLLSYRSSIVAGTQEVRRGQF